MPSSKAKRIILLHVNIMLFSLTGIFSKLAANNIAENGVLHIYTLLLVGLMLLNCAVYALFWQQNLKHFDVHAAYAHRSVYTVWSLIWAVLFFSEDISIGNIIGTALMIAGILVIQSE